MAGVGSRNYPLNFDTFRFGPLGQRVISEYSSTYAKAEGGGVTDEFWGSFIFGPTGDLIGGHITKYVQSSNGHVVLELHNITLSVSDIASAILNDISLGELPIFQGDDGVHSSPYDDLIRTGSGNDLISASGGADTVFAGSGDDVIFGMEDKSYIRGEDGGDQLIGAESFDDLHGNAGNDTLEGRGGDDWVVGGKDQDLLYGGRGNDIVYGNLGNDTCRGDDGNDLVRGGKDNDSLEGGLGNDWLSGDKGDDTISGGREDADVFHTFGDAGIDRVLDFNRADGDRVQVDPGTVYTFAQVGGDVVISMQGGAQMVLVGVSTASLTGDWIFAA